MQNIKINPYQFMVLVVLFSVGTSILIVPSFLASETKQDAWIVAILGTAIGLIVIWLFCLIAQWFPDLTFVQMMEKVLGRWLGKAASLLFVFMSFVYTAILLYYSGTFLNTHLMPNTPMVALNILLAIIIVMGVRLGLETIARSAEVLILICLIFFLFLVFFISPQVNFDNLQPVFEAEPKKIVQTSLSFIEVTSVNAIVLLMIFPAFINTGIKAKKFFLIGNLLGGIVIIIFTFLCVAVLGAYNTGIELYPGYALAKRINVGEFIQRIEALMGTLWIIALYYKATIYFYVTVLGFAQIFNLKDYRPLTIPFGIIAVVISIVIFPDVIYQQRWNTTIGLMFSYTIGIFLLLLLIVVYAIRRKQLRKVPEEP